MDKLSVVRAPLTEEITLGVIGTGQGGSGAFAGIPDLLAQPEGAVRRETGAVGGAAMLQQPVPGGEAGRFAGIVSALIEFDAGHVGQSAYGQRDPFPVPVAVVKRIFGNAFLPQVGAGVLEGDGLQRRIV